MNMKSAKEQIEEMLDYDKSRSSDLYIAHKNDLVILKEAVERYKKDLKRVPLSDQLEGLLDIMIDEFFGDWEKDKEEGK